MPWIFREILVETIRSISFGLTLLAVFWFYGLIRTWPRAIILVGTTVAVHLLDWNEELHLPVRFREYVDLPILGNIEPRIGLASFAVFVVLCAVLLMLTTPRARIEWAILISVLCGMAAAGIITAIDAAQRGAWVSFLRGDALDILWQTSLPFFFGVAVLIKDSSARFYLVTFEERSRAPVWKRLAPACVLILFWIGVTEWCQADQKRFYKQTAEMAAKRDSEFAKVIAERPSLENLSALPLKEPGEILLLEEIDGWKPYYSNSQDYPARKGTDKSPPSPASRTYYVDYVMKGDRLRANVTEYPNAEWAKYEAKISSMTPPNPEFVKKLSRYRNTIFQDGTSFYWPSGNKVIRMDCSGVRPNEIEKSLKIYLEKYPSTF